MNLELAFEGELRKLIKIKNEKFQKKSCRLVYTGEFHYGFNLGLKTRISACVYLRDKSTLKVIHEQFLGLNLSNHCCQMVRF